MRGILGRNEFSAKRNRIFGISKSVIISSNSNSGVNDEHELCYGKLFNKQFYDCAACEDKLKCEKLSKIIKRNK